jgi:hypothetical protein
MPYNLEGDISNAHPHTLDCTLTVEGAAAEAKSTGEAIEKAKTDAKEYTDAHAKDSENPHKITKIHVGLSNVDNTSDMEKPVSTAQAAALKVLSDSLAEVGREKAEVESCVGTLLASEWSEESPFMQEINVDGVLEDDEPFVDINLNDIDDTLSVIEAWGFVGRCVVSSDNTVTAYCYQVRPEVDIPLKFKVVR